MRHQFPQAPDNGIQLGPAWRTYTGSLSNIGNAHLRHHVYSYVAPGCRFDMNPGQARGSQLPQSILQLSKDIVQSCEVQHFAAVLLHSQMLTTLRRILVTP